MSEVTGTASTASVAAPAPAVIDPSAWGAVFSDGPGEATAKGASLDIGSIAKLKAKAGKAKGKVKAKGAAAPKYAAASRSSAASSVSNDREPYEENRPSLFGAPAGGSSAGGFGVGSGGGRKVSALDGAPPPLARKGVKGLSWNKPGAEMKRSYARPWEKNGPQIVYHSPHEHNAASYMQRWWKWKRQDLSGYQIKKLSRKHQNMMMRKIDNFETRNIASIQNAREAMVGGLAAVEDQVRENVADWDEQKTAWHMNEAERHEQEAAALAAEEAERAKREREREREAAKAVAKAEAEQRKRLEAEEKRKREEDAKNAAEEERLRIRMEQMKAEMAATEDMVAKWLEKNCDDSGFYLDMHLNFAFPVDYKVGPGEAEGANDREIKMRKMKQDWVLGMLCQTFLPCSVRNVATLMKTEGWTSVMDSHWFEVIRMLFNEEVVNMTANDDGMPNEVWF